MTFGFNNNKNLNIFKFINLQFELEDYEKCTYDKVFYKMKFS